MAQIIEELYCVEDNGEKYGVFSRVMQDFITYGHPAEYDEWTWNEMLNVKHTLAAAENMKKRATLYRGLPILSRSLAMRR